MTLYLVLDPQRTDNPKPLDDEEDIIIQEKVKVDQIFDLIRSGGMNALGGWACMVAIQKLRDLGEIQ